MKTASNNPENAFMKMARNTDVVRAREIREAGLHPEYLRKPKVDYPPIRIFRFSGPSLIEGIEEKKIEGVAVRVYNPAKDYFCEKKPIQPGNYIPLPLG